MFGPVQGSASTTAISGRGGPSAATMATGAAGPSATSRCSPPLRSTIRRRQRRLSTPPRPRRHDPTRPASPALDRRPEARRGRRPDEPLRQDRVGITECCASAPRGSDDRLTKGENISSEARRARSFGIAAVQRIERYGIDLYSQLRWYELDTGTRARREEHHGRHLRHEVHLLNASGRTLLSAAFTRTGRRPLISSTTSLALPGCRPQLPGGSRPGRAANWTHHGVRRNAVQTISAFSDPGVSFFTHAISSS